MRSTSSRRWPGAMSSLLFAVCALCCVGVARCFVVVTDASSGQSFTFEQSTAASSFPEFAVPALAALNFTLAVSADIGYVDIHLAIPGAMTDNSTYNCVTRTTPTPHAHRHTTQLGPHCTQLLASVVGLCALLLCGWLCVRRGAAQR